MVRRLLTWFFCDSSVDTAAAVLLLSLRSFIESHRWSCCCGLHEGGLRANDQVGVHAIVQFFHAGPLLLLS